MIETPSRGELTHHFYIGPIAEPFSRELIPKPTTTHHTHHRQSENAFTLTALRLHPPAPSSGDIGDGKENTQGIDVSASDTTTGCGVRPVGTDIPAGPVTRAVTLAGETTQAIEGSALAVLLTRVSSKCGRAGGAGVRPMPSWNHASYWKHLTYMLAPEFPIIHMRISRLVYMSIVLSLYPGGLCA
jgi:hypothetical protein